MTPFDTISSFFIVVNFILVKGCKKIVGIRKEIRVGPLISFVISTK
jgi:hypothetical protein